MACCVIMIVSNFSDLRMSGFSPGFFKEWRGGLGVGGMSSGVSKTFG